MSVGGGGGKTGPTEAERGLAARGAMDFNTAMEVVLPTTSALKQRLNQTGAERERAGSEASIAAATATGGDAQGRVSEGGSGKMVSRVGDLSDTVSSSVGQGMAAAGQELDNKKVKGDLRLAKAGRGIATEGTRMLGDLARSKTNEALAKSKAEFTREQSILDTAGTITGAAAAAYGGGSPEADRRTKGLSAPDDGFRGV